MLIHLSYSVCSPIDTGKSSLGVSEFNRAIKLAIDKPLRKDLLE